MSQHGSIPGPQTVEGAKRHIDLIRSEKGLSGPTHRSNDLEAALELISNDLYQKPFHFIRELIQNADDNSYQDERPAITITLDENRLRIDSNEVGFSRENIEAICSIGRSSKPKARRNEEYIGEKGIGFKSVFKVAEVVWITSHAYSFKFDSKERLGKLAPIWAEFPEQKKPGLTSMLLDLRQNWHVAGLRQELWTLDAKLLMFLRKIDQIEVRIRDGGAIQSRLLNRSRAQYSAQGFEVITLEPDVFSPYTIYRYRAQKLRHDTRRQGLDESDIVLGFPNVEKPGFLSKSQSVYSFLPVRDVGFKFILQANFVLIANREDIDPSSEWNSSLLEHIPRAMLEAITLFNQKGLRYSWLQYIPTDPEKQDSFTDLRGTLLGHLRSEPILESRDGELRPPSELTLVPETLCDWNGDSLIPYQASQFQYVSPKYEHGQIDVLYALGVKVLSDVDFLDDLSQFISRCPDVFQNMSLEWQSTLAKVLVPLVPRHKEKILSLQIIRLCDDRWIAAKDGILLTPLKARNLTVPRGLDAYEVHPEAARDISREELLRILGMHDSDTRTICDIIIETHKIYESPPENLLVSDLASHVLFLYEARWRPSEPQDLWFVAEGGACYRGSQLYLAEPSMKASASTIFGRKWPKIRYLHEEYATTFSRHDDWQTWLDKNLDVAALPRLVSRCKGHPSAFEISYDFRFLVSMYPSDVVLELFRLHWGYYRRWIVPQQQPDNVPVRESVVIEESCKLKLLAYLRSLSVKCVDGSTSELSKTYLPRESILVGLDLSDEGHSSEATAELAKLTAAAPKQNVLSKIWNKTFAEKHLTHYPLLDIPHPENSTWDFLSHFGTIIALRPLHFLERLRQLSGTGIENALAATLYDQVISCAKNDEDFGIIKRYFSEKKLIYVPPSYKHTYTPWRWVKASECVWSGPECLRKVPRLQPIYQKPSQRDLFRDVIGIHSAGLKALLTETRGIGPDDPLPYIRDVFIETGRRLHAATYSDIMDNRVSKQLAGAKIWPVTTGNSEYGYDCLMDSDELWYIADHKHLQKTFKGKLPFLALDRGAIDYMSPLLETLGLKRRLISTAAKVQAKPDGEITQLLPYTISMRKKAKYIARLVPVNSSYRSKILDHLQSIDVYQAQQISTRWTVITLSGDVIHGDTEQGRVCVLPSSQGLSIFLIQQDSNIWCPPLELAEELAKSCGIIDSEHFKLLSHLLIQPDVQRIEEDFDRRGLNTDIPGFEVNQKSLDDLSNDEPRSPDKSERRRFSTTRRSLLLAQHNEKTSAIEDIPEVSEMSATTTAVVTDIPGVPAPVSNGNKTSMANDDAVNIVASSSQARETIIIRQAHVKDPTIRSVVQSHYRLVKTKPTHDVIQHGLMSLSMPGELNNGNDEEQHTFSSELYVSSFVRDVLGNAYQPNLHWTSSLRGRVGHKPFIDNNPDISTFTINDTFGKFRNFLIERGCTEAKSFSNTVTFHIQVAVASESLTSSFSLPPSQVKKAEKLSELSQSTATLKEVFILAVVFSLQDDPSMALFVDPWRLHREGSLSLETYSCYWACLDNSVAPLYVRNVANKALSRESKSLYKYRNLRPREIRIFELAPGDDDEGLSGTIQHVSIDEPGDYCALSYVWGVGSSSIVPSYLQTPEGAIEITVSLQAALKAVRKECGVRRLWVDAICIQQDDLVEKVVQIRLLNATFRSASRVIAWLGHEESHSNKAIEVLKMVRNESKSSFWPRFLGGMTTAPSFLPSPSDGIWNCIDSFLDRSWFKRAWIVQELVLPTKVTMLCGESQMEWDDFFEALLVCEQALNIGNAPGSEDVRLLPHAGAAYALGMARKRLQTDKRKYSLLELLSLFSHTQSSKELDKMFALLSIAFDSNHRGFDPDYDSPKQDVIQRYAKCFVQNGHVMDLLSRAGTSKSYSHCSWIPEWTRSNFPQTISTWNDSKGGFYAGSKTPPVASVRDDFGPGSRILEIQGIEVDTVMSTSPIRIGTGKMISFLDAMQDFKKLIGYLGSYPSGESLDDVLLQLPIGMAKAPHLESASDKARFYRNFARETRQEWPADLKRILSLLGPHRDNFDFAQMPTDQRKIVTRYWKTTAALMDRISKAVFCVTKRGYAGLVPGDTRSGDKICVFHGGRAPFIVREQATQFSLKGECFIHGIMHGEALAFDGVVERTFQLV